MSKLPSKEKLIATYEKAVAARDKMNRTPIHLVSIYTDNCTEFMLYSSEPTQVQLDEIQSSYSKEVAWGPEDVRVYYEGTRDLLHLGESK